jgi:hypothetical protein
MPSSLLCSFSCSTLSDYSCQRENTIFQKVFSLLFPNSIQSPHLIHCYSLLLLFLILSLIDEETRKKVHTILVREFDEELEARSNELNIIETRINQTAKLLQQIKHVVLDTGYQSALYLSSIFLEEIRK